MSWWTPSGPLRFSSSLTWSAWNATDSSIHPALPTSVASLLPAIRLLPRHMNLRPTSSGDNFEWVATCFHKSVPTHKCCASNKHFGISVFQTVNKRLLTGQGFDLHSRGQFKHMRRSDCPPMLADHFILTAPCRTGHIGAMLTLLGIPKTFKRVVGQLSDANSLQASCFFAYPYATTCLHRCCLQYLV